MNNPLFSQKKWRQSLGALLLALGISTSYAQTVLVNPATDGGFELGTGSFADNGWIVVNDSQFVANRWYTGTGLSSGAYSFPSASRCAYISNDNGTSWSYANNGQNNSAHFYKDITVPAGETNVSFSFKYQQNGNSGNGRLVVYVCPTANTPVFGQPTAGGATLGGSGWGPNTGTDVVRLLNAYSPELPGTVTFNGTIPYSVLNNCSSSNTFRLVFTWSSSTQVNNPPAAIDEISVISRSPVPSPSSGPFTINKNLPTSGSNFASFTEAVNWLNGVSFCGISNAITFNVAAGQTFYEDVPAITAQGSLSNPIVFQRSGSGANPVITPSGYAGSGDATPRSVDFGLCLRGADYVTIDGIDITAINNQIEYGYLVMNASATNGAMFNTIKNTTILLDRTNITSRGILSISTSTGGIAFSPTNNSGTNNNNSYLNLTIGNVYAGIQFNSSTDLIKDTNNTIGTTAINIYNTIGRANVPDDIGSATLLTASYGINCAFQHNLKLFNCKISNVSTALNGTVDGIFIGSGTGGGLSGGDNRIYNNIISKIRNYNTASATVVVSGLRINHYNTSPGVSIKVYNNVISGITSAYTGTATPNRVIRGINLPINTAITIPNSVTYEIVNNSVVIDGSGSPNASNIVFEADNTAPTYIIRNNLFSNLTVNQTGAAVHYGMAVLSSTTAAGGSNKLGFTGTVSNYNDIYIQNTTNGYVGAFQPNPGTVGTYTNLATLANWQANFTSPTQDVNSISTAPILNSSTILIPNYGSPLTGSFPSLGAPYDVDINGVTRSASNSTIGAYERVGDAIVPTMNDTTLVSVYSNSSRVLPGLLTITDNTEVSTAPGLAPRIYFKKSTDANVFGANNSSTNGWKWVEASNATSPFDFTIDHTLLNGGSAGTNDTIQYFYLAQDTLTIPNITVYPSTGFIGSTVASVTQAPTTPKSYIIFGPPAAYVDGVVTLASNYKVEQNTSNNAVIRVAVQTALTGAPAYVSSITFNAAGFNDYANILNAKVWYTGTSAAFDTTAQFGTTYTTGAGTGALGNFTINGNQLVPNGTSYFWLSYSTKAGAVATDSLDATVVSLTYDGSSQALSVPSAPGNRIIKPAYCIPPITSVGYCISNVTLNTLNNTTGLCGNTFYTSYQPTGNLTTTLVKGLQYTMSVNVSANPAAKVWVMFDYNDNGLFDAAEITQISANTSVNIPTNYTFTVPCSATATELKMRVRSVLNSQNPTDPSCSGSTNSEVEDYIITLLDNPAHYVSSSAIQNTNSIAPGAADRQVMHIKLAASGCGAASLNEVYAHTGLTTNAGDILSAKLYATGNTTSFNTGTLLATVASPSGAFTFTGFSNTLLANPGDTNNYWIAYDINPAATLTNVIDIRVDSVQTAGAYNVPTNNNPVGTSVIETPMTYVSSIVTHPTTNSVPVTTNNAQILKVNIQTSLTGAPVELTKFNLNTVAGLSDTTYISTARMYYTGSTNTFSTTTLFGTGSGANLTSATWDRYSISGTQLLTNGDNYFWLVYDIKTTSIIGGTIDAALDSAILNGSLITPSSVNLNGNRLVRAQYCASIPSTANFEEIYNVTVGSINNTSACFTTANNSQSIVGRYSDYSALSSNVSRGVMVPYSIKTGSCGSFGGGDSVYIYIDWNQDGDFIDAGENPIRRAVAAVNNTFTTGSFMVPCNAITGETRMRVIFASIISSSMTPCLASTNPYAQGETEDYTLTVVDNPISVVSLNPIQSSSYVAQATNDNMIMRIPVIAQGCGSTNANAFFFRTAGSTNAVDIQSAKLYFTGTSATFNTTNLLGIVSSPIDTFSFTSFASALSPTPGDTTNFWLAYDIEPGATLTNVVDAVLDSMHTDLGNHPSAAGNPAGNALISPYMTHLETEVTHPDLSATGASNLAKQVLKIRIVTSSTGAPANLTGFNLSNTGSGADGANIDSIRVFSTGHNNTFSTTTKFGSYTSLTPGNWGTYTIAGNQFLLNDTNYFWVVYSLKATPTITDSLDAALVSSTINASPYIPVNGNPAGRILIRAEYCASGSTVVTGANALSITRVQLSNLNNASSCPAVSYSNFTNIAPANISRNTDYPFTITTSACAIGSPFTATAIFIDYNQDGDFFDVGETVFNNATNTDPSLPLSGNFTVPCSAYLGATRMRVIRYNLALVPTISSCGTYASFGETEDYIVNILENPQTYTSSRAIQSPALATAGVDEVMMQIKVKATNCGNGEVTEMYFNTEGSDNPNNDIAAAKLYSTGSSTTFSTSNLLGTITNPIGAFSFTFNNTLLTNNADTNNYWLVYEVTPYAGLYDTLDVQIDSMMVLGNYVIPTNNIPSQYKVLDFPMTYVSSTVSQGTFDNVIQGTNDMMMLRMEVVGTSNGSPLTVTQFNLNTNGGGDDSLNISSAKIYYTGNDSNFATTNLFGTYPLTPPTTLKWPSYAINGSQALANDTNYFWLVYDIKANAIISDSVDAELASVVVAGITQIPTVTAPAGNIFIRSEYCTPSNSTAGRCITNVHFGSINNTTGCAPTNPYYTLFPDSVGTTTNIYRNSSLPITVSANSPSYMVVFIDFNRNGLYSDPGEQFDLSTVSQVSSATMNIAIPATARLGLSRIRIRTHNSPVGTGLHYSCNGYNNSETEEYYINIMPEIPPTTYVWNQTTPADFTVDSNWTPIRLANSMQDRLVFGDGTPTTLTVNNVNNQANATIELAPSTRVIFNTGSAATLSVNDSLILGDNSIIQSNTVVFEVGTGIANPGILTTGIQAGINGTLKRWTATGAANLVFPLCDSNGTNRTVQINYTTAPTSNGTLQASFVKTPVSGTAGLPLTDVLASVTINKLSVDGFWNFSEGNGLIGGVYTGTFNVDSFTATPAVTSLMVISRIDQFSNWTLNGAYNASTGSPTNAIVERTGMSGFGQFTIASDSVQNPLPVTLLSFTAKADQANALVQWTTSSEINNRGFDLERSIDGRTFENITFVKGNGTSMVAHQYAYNDMSAFAKAGSNVVYYRLKQVDLNGNFTYSQIVRVSKASSSLSAVSVSPNPFASSFSLNIETTIDQTVTVITTDFQGRTVATEQVAITKGSNSLSFDNLSQLRAGMYFIKVISANDTQVIKVVKQ